MNHPKRGPMKPAPDDADAGQAAPLDVTPLDHAMIRPIIAGIMLAMFLSALEQTIIAPALPTIGRVLSGVENLSFVVTAYLLAATAVTPLFGKLSDIHGRRTVLLVAVGIFIIGSVGRRVGKESRTRIAARALQGTRAGGLLPIAQTISARPSDLEHRRRGICGEVPMFMAASVLGPVL